MKNFLVSVIHLVSGFICYWLMLTMILWHWDFPRGDRIAFFVGACISLLLDLAICFLVSKQKGSIFLFEKWRHFAGTALIPVFLFIVLNPSWFKDGPYTLAIMQNVVAISVAMVAERLVVCWKM